MVWLGSWLSGYLIVATDAWMQHPVGYSVGPTGQFFLASFWGLLLNPWALWQFAHTMLGATQTGCFVMAAIGAFYLLAGRDMSITVARFVRVGVIVGVLAALLQLFPTGDEPGTHDHARSTGNAGGHGGTVPSSEAARRSSFSASPTFERQRIDNPLVVPDALSFLTYRAWTAEVRGLDEFPQIGLAGSHSAALLQLSHHGRTRHDLHRHHLIAALQLWRGTLYSSRPMLWILMLALPFPYIANTAGWMTAEVGRQPWLIYGLDAHRRRRFAAGFGGQRLVHVAWVYAACTWCWRFCSSFWFLTRSTAAGASPRYGRAKRHGASSMEHDLVLSGRV